MKKKKIELNKKLLLNKETIVALNESQLAKFAGGATTDCKTYNAECPTPATACFICPPISEKCPTYNAECPTEMTLCFICPPLTAKCQ